MGQCQSADGVAATIGGDPELHKTAKRIEATLLASESEWDHTSTFGRSQALTSSIASRTTLGGGDSSTNVTGGSERRYPLGVITGSSRNESNNKGFSSSVDNNNRSSNQAPAVSRAVVAPAPAPPVKPPEPEPLRWEDVEMPHVEEEEAKALLEEALELIDEDQDQDNSNSNSNNNINCCGATIIEEEREEEKVEEQDEAPEAADDEGEADNSSSDNSTAALEKLNASLQRLVKTGKKQEPQCATVHMQIGRILASQSQGDYKQALRHYRAGQEIFRIRLGKEDPTTVLADQQIKATLKKLIFKVTVKKK